MKPGGRYCTELCIKKIPCTFWRCANGALGFGGFFFFSSRNMKYNYLRRLISGLQESLVNEGFGFAGFLLVEVLLYKAFLFCRWNRQCWSSPGAWVLQRAAPSPGLEAPRWADRAVKFSAGPRHPVLRKKAASLGTPAIRLQRQRVAHPSIWRWASVCLLSRTGPLEYAGELGALTPGVRA